MKVKTEIVTLFDKSKPFELESGSDLFPVQVAYQTYGELNSEGTNAVLICHALTGNAHAAGVLTDEENDNRSNPDLLNKYSILNKRKTGWWNELIGEGKLFDTKKYFVISSNILGSCYGTTGPISIKNIFNRNFGVNFPTVTVRDMVKLQKELIDYLNVQKLATVAGGSLGGMQVLEWAVMYPEVVESIIPIATSAQHSPWAISLNEASRHAIKNDPKWMSGNYKSQPYNGLALARKIAMISYRSMGSFEQKFSRERKNENSSKLDTENIFQIESYLNHHGDKLNQRFDANTYIYLSHAMDLHDVALNRNSLEEVLGSINIPALSVGISSDILYPPDEQKIIASLIPNAGYKEIDSIHGHDGFLIEFDQMTEMIRKFLLDNNL